MPHIDGELPDGRTVSEAVSAFFCELCGRLKDRPNHDCSDLTRMPVTSNDGGDA